MQKGMNKGVAFVIVGALVLFSIAQLFRTDTKTEDVPLTQKVTVYFANTVKNPNSIDCSLVYPVERVVEEGNKTPEAAIGFLFSGPTQAEKTEGYISMLSGFAPNALKSASIVHGVATLDFDTLPSGGSCLVGTTRAQIEKTVQEFPGVTEVHIMLRGSEAEALQP